MKKQAVIFDHSPPSVYSERLLNSQRSIDEERIIPSKIRPVKPNDVQKVVEHSEKFQRLINQGQRILFRVHSVFPFDLFPDSVVIDETKVTMIHREFFFNSEIQSLPYDNIQDVTVETSIFFAALKILPVGYSERWLSVAYLWRNQAIRARRIILGVILGRKEGIDFEKVSVPNFLQKVEHLGKIN